MGSNSRRHIFHAAATGVAGQTTRPFREMIPIQAASSLTADGGSGSARVDGYRHRDILTFGSAHTEVVGIESDEGFETLAVSVVEKLNLMDVVTCDRIVGRLTGKHPHKQKEGVHSPTENFIVPTGSRFEGLRVGNRHFERLEVAPEFFCKTEHACWSGLLGALENEADRKMLEGLSIPAPNGDRVPLQGRERSSKSMGFYIALDERTAEFVLGAPLRLRVEHFGTVHLGEFFCDPASRRLIMLRAELNGAVQGRVNICDPLINGEFYP